MPSDDRVALALSRDRAVVDDAAWKDLVDRAHRTLRSLVAGGVATAVRAGRDVALLASGSFVRELPSPDSPQAAVLASARTAVRADGTHLPSLDVLADRSLAGIRAELADAVPPFSYIAWAGADGELCAATDHLGLQHIYVASGHGFAAVSTSSTLAALLSGAGLDEHACAVYSLIGNFLTGRSMFDGVRKLGPAETVSLHGGRVASALDRDRVPAMVRGGGWFATQAEAITAGREVLSGIVEALAAAHPRPLLELSGGLDTRVLVAAGRHCGYGDVSTLTIGLEGDPDVVIARRIAEASGLDGTFVPVSLLDHHEPVDVLARVRLAADQRDFAADPVSGALYDAIEAEVPAREQISGIGGELARGNYYTGQREQPGYDADLVERIMRWRLASNFAASATLFDPEFRRSAEAWLRADSWSYVDGLGVPWPIATDELYLYARLQPWGGAVYSRRGAGRQILAPLYHPRFVEWCSRIPLELKRNSRTFSALLDDLAPDLARLPLDSGLTPYQLSDRGLRSRVATRIGDARRIARKVRRQLARRGKTAAGTQRLSAGVLQAWRADPPHELAGVAWLDQEALEQVHAGALALSTPSVAFLANLSGALRQVRAGTAVGTSS